MTDVSPTTTASTPTASTPPTVAEAQAAAEAAQAQLAAAQAAQTAAQNAADLAVLQPLAFLAGPTFAADLATLKAQLPTLMAYNYQWGQRVMRLIQILTNDGAALASAYTKAGGVAPAS